jgi:hypothetical protein
MVAQPCPPVVEYFFFLHKRKDNSTIASSFDYLSRFELRRFMWCRKTEWLSFGHLDMVETFQMRTTVSRDKFNLPPRSSQSTVVVTGADLRIGMRNGQLTVDTITSLS